jgi:outer membrane protein TolC
LKGFKNSHSPVLEDKWWAAFQDENLNKLIDSAMQSNFDLAATWQQFLAAKATVSREASNKWPFYGTISPEHTNVFKNVLK